MPIFENWLKALHIDFIQCAILVLGVLEVLLARANNSWLYPTGIAATVLSIYSLFNVQLYAECLLQFYYIIMSIYGWWYWTTQQQAKPVLITFSSSKDWLIALSIAFGGWILLYGFLVKFTPSQLPAWDASISSTGWAGMWLLARRKVENWLLLNISNVLAIPLLFHKQLPLFALLTIFLFAIACRGYVDWKRIVRKRIVSIPEKGSQ